MKFYTQEEIDIFDNYFIKNGNLSNQNMKSYLLKNENNMEDKFVIVLNEHNIAKVKSLPMYLCEKNNFYYTNTKFKKLIALIKDFGYQ